MKNKIAPFILLSLLGVVLFFTGGFLKGIDKNIASVCIGIGTGILGMSIAMIATILVEKKYPKIAKQKSIDVNDERNIRIKEKASAKTNRIMSYVLYILTLIFTLMDASLYITILMVAAIIIQVSLFILFSDKYSKEM